MGHFDHLDDPLMEAVNDPNKTVGNVVNLHFECCPKCRGSGNTRWGPCFKCKGKGKLSFATSTEHRETQRAKRAAKRERTAGEHLAQLSADHPKVHKWLLFNATRSDFAQSLVDSVRRFGSLTERQLAAVYRNVEKEETKAKARLNLVSEPVDVSRIQAAFDHARQHACTKAGTKAKLRAPRMFIGGIKFKPAPEHGRHPGAIYVTEAGGEKRYLGLIESGVFTAQPACTEVTIAEIKRIAEDPRSAAEAHGELHGNCAICGRELTKHKSIDRGIGPVCARRMGW